MRPKKRMRIENESEKVDDTIEISKLEKGIELLDDIDSNDITKFSELPISQNTIKGLTETDFIEPTKVQRQTLVHTLRSKDVVAASKTGSGKTLAFIIPMLELLYRNKWSSDDGVGALIITPTRELAYQLFEFLNVVGKHHSFSCGLIIGGKDLRHEWEKVGNLNIIICTPGRIMQHITENSIFDVANLQVLILDEADECLSMGFEKTMKVIFRNLPKSRQTLLFSATQTKNIKDLSFAGCKEAIICFSHEKSKTITPKKLVQAFYVCKLEEKIEFLWTFIKDHITEKLLIFVTTCKQAKYYSDIFSKLDHSLNVLTLHGSMHQLRRMAVYDEYCSKKRGFLIATDVAARGLDFPNVHWVVQLDCPDNAKVYIHRVGRTARFDDEGRTVLILTPMQKEPVLAELDSHNIKIQEVEKYPSVFASISNRLQNLLAKNVELKEQAVRVFYSYLKALSKTRSAFCDLASVDFDEFARSLGLAKTPDVNFLNRKIISLKKIQPIEKPQVEIPNIDGDKYYTKNKSPNESISKSEIKQEIRKVQSNETIKNDKKYDTNQITVDELLKVSDHPTVELAPINTISSKSKTKVVTKYSIAKNLKQKGIVVNSKILFDDEGHSGINENKNEIPRKESNDGIDYSYYMQKIKEEDKSDKRVHLDKRKQKKNKKKKQQN